MNESALAIRRNSDESDGVIKLPMVDATAADKPEGSGELIWNDDNPPADNYDALGERLAKCRDLFRRPQYGDGLILLLPNDKTTNITKGADLASVVVDRVRVRVLKDGKPKGGQIAAAHLNAMLKCDTFLDHFQTVDLVATVPFYLAHFRQRTGRSNEALSELSTTTPKWELSSWRMPGSTVETVSLLLHSSNDLPRTRSHCCSRRGPVIAETMAA